MQYISHNFATFLWSTEFEHEIVINSIYAAKWHNNNLAQEKSTFLNKLHGNSNLINHDYKVNHKIMIMNNSILKRKIDKPSWNFPNY